MNIKNSLLRLKNDLISKQRNDEAGRDAISSTCDDIKMITSNQELEINCGTEAKDEFNEPCYMKPRNLDDKINLFIEWYFKNMVKGHYTSVGEYRQPREMRNFIEKMAVWYELRFPDYEVNKLMPGSGLEEVNINEIMFDDNEYVNELVDEDSLIKEFDWSEFYSANSFISSLQWEERRLFENPRYRPIVYLDKWSKDFYLTLSEDGFVTGAENIELWTFYAIRTCDLFNLHIKDVLKLFEERGIKLPKGNELEETVRNADKWIYQREGLLDSVMYRIIERGGNRIGPRRGLLFAKEFHRNIDIPMKYGVDYSDPGLRLFMNEYLKAGGCKDLSCYVGYFSRANETEKLDTVTVQELILTKGDNMETFYTKEENQLHERFVKSLVKKN